MKQTEKARIMAIFSLWQQAAPHPGSELQFASAFELLVAVILSAQATDVGVNRVTQKLFAVANTAQALLALGEEGIIAHIRSLGLYRNKAKHLLAMSQLLLHEYGGEVPQERAALQRLPGVGRKTANVVLNVAFGQPTLAVDTHVFRVAHRLALAQGRTPEAVEQELLRCIPEQFLAHAHHWILLHGRHVCQARQPRCAQCPLPAYCPQAFAGQRIKENQKK
ncbi:endonuclease III [Candidatus Magnetaquicoccus inordinatus]|uniref:endonuclease III n=1 Tax=Candidatus Magnetaquicoccus inordinatus TaxID=2496818 RepID=UPI00102BF8D5|nr:endonuclease III [Candidatus Magnetaquicoccus inordinatus]